MVLEEWPMKEDNVIRIKSKQFAVRIVKLNRYLIAEKQEYVLARQILRSGTSIGANVAESEYAISRNDFALKLYIALKECNETRYWLELLYETEYITEEQFRSLIADCIELQKILTAITKKVKPSR